MIAGKVHDGEEVTVDYDEAKDELTIKAGSLEPSLQTA